ncbi:hypothetical protein [Streptomyces acidiscabies]|uniref:hypothetical protein n=1 Tax=Streptomyces acidiscabies TaxID=42234 RepID=UPI0038F72437
MSFSSVSAGWGVRALARASCVIWSFVHVLELTPAQPPVCGLTGGEPAKCRAAVVA